jgi:3-oxoacyl-[acyl-carrier protein] reductase
VAERHVIVSGSSRGIGLAIANAFLAGGDHVTVTGRDADGVAAAAARLDEEHGAGRTLPFAGDLTDRVEIARLIETVRERWASVDVCVLNVGTGRGALGPTPGAEEWDRLFRQNLWSAVAVAEAVVPSMVEAGQGNLVFISSIAGIESVGAPLPYETAKAAVVAYANGLARSVGSSGIRVNTVAPGNILFAGGRWEELLAADTSGVERMLQENVPLQRFGTPEEIAEAVVYLASDRASFVTGATLVVDGGQTHG